jgi:uncharacterized protein YecE (DUF72 family)
MNTGRIHVGVGGWDYEPWRETFYPAEAAQGAQLEHAGQVLTATEINATHYKLQKPETFERWAKAVPDGFKFAVKASRFCTNRKALCEGGRRDRQILRAGADRAWRQAGADPVAVHGHEEVRSGRFSRLPAAASEHAGRRTASPRG